MSEAKGLYNNIYRMNDIEYSPDREVDDDPSFFSKINNHRSLICKLLLVAATLIILFQGGIILIAKPNTGIHADQQTLPTNTVFPERQILSDQTPSISVCKQLGYPEFGSEAFFASKITKTNVDGSKQNFGTNMVLKIPPTNNYQVFKQNIKKQILKNVELSTHSLVINIKRNSEIEIVFREFPADDPTGDTLVDYRSTKSVMYYMHFNTQTKIFDFFETRFANSPEPQVKTETFVMNEIKTRLKAATASKCSEQFDVPSIITTIH